jgi:hypothetical protein
MSSTVAALRSIRGDKSKGDCVVACVTADRLPQSLCLLDSLRRHDDVPFILTLIGGCDGDNPLHRYPNTAVITTADLDLPQSRRFVFQYTPFELSCAVKPWLINHAISLGFHRIVYLDCDIQVYDGLTSIFAAVDSPAGVLLTPHYIAGTGSRSTYFPSDVRATGIFNAGFVGVAATPNGRQFLRFWMERCRSDCIVDFAGGVHVDQGWLDVAAALLPGVGVVREQGWNVGYWNVAEQPLRRAENGGIIAGDKPLRFFHFSGFDPLQPQRLSKHCKVCPKDEQPLLQELLNEYARSLEASAAVEQSRRIYPFNNLSDGTAISPLWREAVRLNHPILADIENPFDVAANHKLKKRLCQAAVDVVDSRRDWQQGAAVAIGKRIQAIPGIGWAYRHLRARVERYR